MADENPAYHGDCSNGQIYGIWELGHAQLDLLGHRWLQAVQGRLPHDGSWRIKSHLIILLVRSRRLYRDLVGHVGRLLRQWRDVHVHATRRRSRQRGSGLVSCRLSIPCSSTQSPSQVRRDHSIPRPSRAPIITFVVKSARRGVGSWGLCA